MKTKYSNELAEKIAGYIAEGCTYKEAYKKAGIGHCAFFKYLNEIKEFKELIKKAVEERDRVIEGEAIKCIMNAIQKGTWQAAAWWLERTNPEKYALKQRTKEELFSEIKLTIVDA